MQASHSSEFEGLDMGEFSGGMDSCLRRNDDMGGFRGSGEEIGHSALPPPWIPEYSGITGESGVGVYSAASGVNLGQGYEESGE